MDAPIAWIVAGAATAGFVQGLTGFGFGLVAMSFWAWVLDPKLAAVLAVFSALTGQVVPAVRPDPALDDRRCDAYRGVPAGG